MRDAWLWFYALATALKLWVVSAQTVFVIAPSPHDDQLFLSGAASILRGAWLGPFTDMTLAKGPVYSLWLALVHLTHVRVLLCQAILYAAACAMFVRAVRPVIRDEWRRAIIYVAVLFVPSSWASPAATRIIREGIYPSLSLLLIGLAAGAVLRLRGQPRAATAWAAAAGFAGALLVMTREEGVWLLPAFAVIVVAGTVTTGPLRLRMLLLPVGAAIVAYLLPTLSVATLNWRSYRAFQTCEFRSSYFTSAYGSLTRVKTARWNPYVPVPREARFKMYDVSPALAEVRPILEASAPGWTTHGCAALNVCDDIAGGWFMWAFRGAASNAGKYRDGRTARAWYEQVTREVDQACREGRLDCAPARSTLMPRWNAAYGRPLADALLRATRFLVHVDGMTPVSGAPIGGTADIDEYERLTNERIPKPVIDMAGTLEGNVGELAVTVFDGLGRPVSDSISRVGVIAPAHDEHSDPKRSIRVETIVPCASDCSIEISAAGQGRLAIPLAETTRAVVGGRLRWTTERFERRSSGAESPRLRALAVTSRAYSAVMPPLLLLACAALIWRIASGVRARSASFTTILAVALAAAVASRIALLSFIEVTSFPAINVIYMSPAYPLLVLLIAVVVLGGSEPLSDSAPWKRNQS